MALLLSPFKTIYLDAAWYIFAIMFLTLKQATLNSQVHLPCNNAFAKCLVIICGFFWYLDHFLTSKPMRLTSISTNRVIWDFKVF